MIDITVEIIPSKHAELQLTRRSFFDSFDFLSGPLELIPDFRNERKFFLKKSNVIMAVEKYDDQTYVISTVLTDFNIIEKNKQIIENYKVIKHERNS